LLNKNLVTRALGIEAIVPADIAEYRLEAEDIYLLCSDGLTDMVEPETVQTILDGKRGVLPEAAAEMVDLANRNGGRDNISVVLVRVPADFLPQSGWAQRFLAKRKATG
jgi:protein phosphatase